MKRYYIAYGSNLNLGQMSYRCPGSKVVATSVIEGYELLFKGSKTGSYLTIEKRSGSHVPVAVWEVTPQDEARLDRYEGCPAFYYKAEMTLPVEYFSGRRGRLRCFVYIMHEERKIGVPDMYYFNACMAGYRSFGFDGKVLEAALDKSMEVCDEDRPV